MWSRGDKREKDQVGIKEISSSLWLKSSDSRRWREWEREGWEGWNATTKIKISPLADETSTMERHREREKDREREREKEKEGKSNTKSDGPKSRMYRANSDRFYCRCLLLSNHEQDHQLLKKGIYDSLLCYIVPLFFFFTFSHEMAWLT